MAPERSRRGGRVRPGLGGSPAPFELMVRGEIQMLRRGPYYT